MIKTQAIDHVSLWVRSLSDTKNYYERVFGFVCTPRENDNSTMVVESENVHFFISESKSDSEFLSKQHVSFRVESLETVIEELESLGITEYKVGQVSLFIHNNYKWCEWRDPSGIRLECIEII